MSGPNQVPVSNASRSSLASEPVRGTETGPGDDVLTLEEFVDPESGQIVYADPVAPNSAGLERSHVADGTGPLSTSDLVVRQGVISRRGATEGDSALGPVSSLPRDRMAAGWDEIRAAMREAESSRTTSDDIVMRPGGTIELQAKAESSSAPISTLPRERMAALSTARGRTGISYEDLAEVTRLDPANAESWSPIYHPLPGFRFRLNAHPFPDLPAFQFFVFRSASDGGLWRVAVLQPNMDHRIGHDPHILPITLGGQQRAVICGPSGRACRTLTEARQHAGKWKTYTAYKLAGRDPGFSL